MVYEISKICLAMHGNSHDDIIDLGFSLEYSWQKGDIKMFWLENRKKYCYKFSSATPFLPKFTSLKSTMKNQDTV